ncbi:MAG: hypothetical protein PHY28_00410 [Dehalococcoidales bacterium]|nr:hypothetical protein [Dehalococcoidales bacterium]
MNSINITLLLVSILPVVLLSLTVVSCTDEAPVTTSPPVQVPAAPNDSIVTAETVAIQEGEGSLPWVLTIEIQTSQNVPGTPNMTSDKIGQQLLVRTDENVSKLRIGQVITAHVRFEGDEHSSFYFMWDIH